MTAETKPPFDPEAEARAMLNRYSETPDALCVSLDNLVADLARRAFEAGAAAGCVAQFNATTKWMTSRFGPTNARDYAYNAPCLGVTPGTHPPRVLPLSETP